MQTAGPADSPEPSQSQQTQSPSTGDNQLQQPRRSSFGFLRRQKSTEMRNASGGRSVSNGKISKKQKALAQQQREAAAVAKQPPRLPSHPPLPQINTFGGDDSRPDSLAIISNRAGAYGQGDYTGRPSADNSMMSSSPPPKVPIPPIPGSSPGEYVDPYARTESMTHRGRYSYASSAISTINSPRRVRRRKDPTPFNILVIGAKNSGKTSFIDFLRTSLALPKRRVQTPSPPRTTESHSSAFNSHYLETEIDNERIGLTLWDSQGLEKNIVDLQLREMASFLESKFEETFTEEQKVIRAPGVRDTHIHCVFLILDPARLDTNIAAWRKALSAGMINKSSAQARIVGALDEDFDLQVLRTLQGKTTVIPVISKADTVTTPHMMYLKKTVWESLKHAKLDPLEALDLDDLDSDADSNRIDEQDEDDLDEEDRRSDGPDDIPGGFDASDPDVSSSPSNAVKRPPHRRTASSMSQTISSAAAAEPELPYLPLSVLSPDTYAPGIIGRQFPWGFADPFDANHCDFVRLKESVFSEWRSELREAARERWYEGWRTSRLKKRGGNWDKSSVKGGASPGPAAAASSPAPNGGALKASSATGSPDAQRYLRAQAV